MKGLEYKKTTHLDAGIAVDEYGTARNHTHKYLASISKADPRMARIYKKPLAKRVYNVRHHKTVIGRFFDKQEALNFARKAIPSSKNITSKFQGEFWEVMIKKAHQ